MGGFGYTDSGMGALMQSMRWRHYDFDLHTGVGIGFVAQKMRSSGRFLDAEVGGEVPC